jgi:hypothetical protein
MKARELIVRSEFALGWRRMPGLSSSLRQRVPPISRPSAKWHGANAMCGGKAPISI